MSKKLKLDKHLYLIGPRGSGKSCLARLLAEELKVYFYDVDAVVRREEGRSIEQIVRERGWDEFRTLESSALARLAEKLAPAVIATGGGVVLQSANCELMRNSGTVVYLKAPLHILLERVTRGAPSDHRPALTDLPPEQEMARILNERESLYTAAAAATLDAALPKADVVAAILKIVGQTAQDV